MTEKYGKRRLKMIEHLIFILERPRLLPNHSSSRSSDTRPQKLQKVYDRAGRMWFKRLASILEPF